MTTIRNFALFLLSTFPIGLLAQQNDLLLKANGLFDNYSYNNALKVYQKINDKSPEIYRKMADSYRLTGNSELAEIHYDSLFSTSIEEDTMAHYHYAEILKKNGKYSEAMNEMKIYNDLRPDRRASMHLRNASYVKQLMNQKVDYAIQNLDINTENSDFGTSFWNEKVIFASSREGIKLIKREYNWNNKPFLDLYVANVNDSTQQLQGLVELDKKINTRFHEGPVSFDKARNRLFFTRNNYFAGKKKMSQDGTNNLKVFYVDKTETGWSSEKSIPFNSDEYSVGHPSVSEDGSKLYFASDMPNGNGGVDLYYCDLIADSLGSPTNLGEKINTEGHEMFPFIHQSGILFFASDGHPGLGGLDVFMVDSKNPSLVKNMGSPLNNQQDDFALIVDQDLHNGYFSSNREGGKGDDDIYQIAINSELYFNKKIIGKTINEKDGSPLSGTVVKLFDVRGEPLKEFTTGEDGTFEFEIEQGESFKISGSKPDWGIKGDDLSFENSSTIEHTITLKKAELFKLIAFITEEGVGTPIEGVKVILTNALDQKIELITDANGNFEKQLDKSLKINDILDYTVELTREGYLSKTLPYNKTLSAVRTIKLHEELDFSLTKAGLGTDLAKLIDVQPIYFDLGKYNIRKDASVELDKIVKVMNENPTMEVELGSHTDCRGSAKSNKRLSDKRAKSSAAYIKKNISTPERIFGKGFGEESLSNDCGCEGAQKSDCSEEAHQENRRTEFKIIKL